MWYVGRMIHVVPPCSDVIFVFTRGLGAKTQPTSHLFLEYWMYNLLLMSVVSSSGDSISGTHRGAFPPTSGIFRSNLFSPPRNSRILFESISQLKSSQTQFAQLKVSYLFGTGFTEEASQIAHLFGPNSPLFSPTPYAHQQTSLKSSMTEDLFGRPALEPLRATSVWTLAQLTVSSLTKMALGYLRPGGNCPPETYSLRAEHLLGPRREHLIRLHRPIWG
jgi:hypothetical protein